MNVMNLVIIGSGYVGLVTGACLAQKGHNITCVDISKEKIDGLKRGVVPIYEPGLDVMILSNREAGRLEFTTSLPEAMRGADIYCIAVGTPPGEDGSADLSHVLAVAMTADVVDQPFMHQQHLRPAGDIRVNGHGEDRVVELAVDPVELVTPHLLDLEP